MNFIKISVLSILTLVMCWGVGICATPLLPEGGVGYTVSAGTISGYYSYTITEDGSYYITTDSKFTGNININNTLQSINIDGNNLIFPTQSIKYDNAQSFTNSLIVNNITLNSISFKSQNGAHGSGGGLYINNVYVGYGKPGQNGYQQGSLNFWGHNIQVNTLNLQTGNGGNGGGGGGGRGTIYSDNNNPYYMGYAGENGIQNQAGKGGNAGYGSSGGTSSWQKATAG